MSYFKMNYVGVVNLHPFNIRQFGGSAFYPDLFALSPATNDDRGQDSDLDSEPSDNPGYTRTPLREGVRSDVIVVCTDGNKRIFVIPNTWVELRNKLVKDMKDYFGTNEATIPPDLISGGNYAVFFKGIWSRVCLLHMTSANKAKLIFYDEGIVRKMYIDRIKTLPEQFLTPGPLVVEIEYNEYCPPLSKGELVTFELRRMVQPDFWLVEFVAGPKSTGNIMALILGNWIFEAQSMFSCTDLVKISHMATLSMATEGYKLPALGVLFPVKILRETYKHIIAIPVMWLNELYNIVWELPAISLTCKRLPYDMIVPGTSCAVPYAGGWFRARIRSADKAVNITAIKVRLIDTGFIMHLDRYEARVLPPQLLPSNKKPLCFAIKKTAGMSKALPVGAFRCIKLERKDKEDNSWIATPHEEPCLCH